MKRFFTFLVFFLALLYALYVYANPVSYSQSDTEGVYYKNE